ncbi:MAG: hypothetical protein R3B96_23120 [Pirellulaceae bacterium]
MRLQKRSSRSATTDRLACGTVFPDSSIVVYRNEDGNDEALELEFWGRFETSEGVLPPAAYVLPPGMSLLAERPLARAHGRANHRGLDRRSHSMGLSQRTQQDSFQGYIKRTNSSLPR